MTLFELRRKLEEAKKKGKTIADLAIKESRDFTADERSQVDAVRAEITDLNNKIAVIETRDAFQPAGIEDRDGGRLGPDLPDTDDEKRPYSLLRALHLSLESRGRYDGLEGEIHQELNKNRTSMGLEPARGILVPMSLHSRRLAKKMGFETRDLTTSTAAGGIANILGVPMIDLLRNKMVMKGLGAAVLSGLIGGTFSLPKQTSAAQAFHTPEAVAAAITNMTLGQVTWSPRTLTALTAMTRKTLLQTSLDVEAEARKDLTAVMAIEFDRVGINGSGQDNQPLGIMQDPDVPTISIGTNGGTIDWPTTVGLETQVATSNADFGNLAYLTSNKGRGVMKKTLKFPSSASAVTLWEKGIAYGEGEVNSYRAVATNQVPSNIAKGSGTNLTSLIFGNFASATYGLWSGVDTLVDPYSRGAAGSILIYMFQDYDFQMRWEQSFAKCVDMLSS